MKSGSCCTIIDLSKRKLRSISVLLYNTVGLWGGGKKRLKSGTNHIMVTYWGGVIEGKEFLIISYSQFYFEIAGMVTCCRGGGGSKNRTIIFASSNLRNWIYIIQNGACHGLQANTLTVHKPKDRLRRVLGFVVRHLVALFQVQLL